MQVHRTGLVDIAAGVCTALRFSRVLCHSGAAPSSSFSQPDALPLRGVHSLYRQHAGQVLRFFTPSASTAPATVLSCLSDHSRVRLMSPEMTALVAEISAQDAARAETALASQSAASPRLAENSDLVRFVNVLVSYLNSETELEQRLSSRNAPRRIQARAWDAQFGQKIRPTPLQRQELMRAACEIVQQRQVPLVVATRLLRCRWPRSFALDTGVAQQRFLRDSLWAWLSDALSAVPTDPHALTPRDARAVLDNCSFAARDAPSTLRRATTSSGKQPQAGPGDLVAPLALLAIQDLDSITIAEPLITLLWSVHTARVPAPETFWRPVVERLLVLNHQLGADDAASPPRSNRSHRNDTYRAGHFFSGLTTRHLYRLVSLVKKERWAVEVSVLHELADLALKNIVFETEKLFDTTTTSTADGTGEPLLTKRDVRKRIRAVADLSEEEFFDLLLISGELGIPFSVSASKVADALLTPLVPHLDIQQLLALLQIVRQTRCHSVPLIAAAAAAVQRRGPDVPYALPLAKALLRTILREPPLQAQVDLTAFYVYFVRMAVSVSTKVRAQELATLAAILYDLHRQLSPQSTVAGRIREAVDLLCAQMALLVALQLASDDDAAKVLEYTVVLGMRQDAAARYPHVQKLLEARSQGVIREQAGEPSEQLANLIADAATQPAEIVSFWESQPEAELPQLPKAAVRVYEELIYIFERAVTVRTTPTAVDVDRLSQVLDRTGLYGLLVGLDRLGRAHFNSAGVPSLAADSPLYLPRKNPIPNQLPGILEERVLKAVTRRIRNAKLKPSSTDNDVLHVLGHVHCDASKIAFLLRVVERSPSCMVRQQRALWEYLEELARRFGDDAQLARIRQCKDSALY